MGRSLLRSIFLAVRRHDLVKGRVLQLFPGGLHVEGRVRVTKSVGGVSASSAHGLLVGIFTGRCREPTSRLLARLYKGDLLLAACDGPVATSLADDLKLLEKSALVPREADLGNATVRVDA